MPRRRPAQDEDVRWLMSQVRTQSSRGPEPIGEVMSRLLSRRGYANVQIAYEWKEVWKQAAGEFASRTRPGKFSRGVLEVLVQNSATLQDLTFQKKELLATLGRLAPQFKVRDLRFKVGPVE